MENDKAEAIKSRGSRRIHIPEKSAVHGSLLAFNGFLLTIKGKHGPDVGEHLLCQSSSFSVHHLLFITEPHKHLQRCNS